MDDRLTKCDVPIRPTGHRLAAAMGLSACAVALLLTTLGVFLDAVMEMTISGSDTGEPLDLFIRGDAPSIPDQPTAPDERLHRPQVIVSEKSAPPLTDAEPTRDWLAIAERAATASVDEHFRHEESRAALWRKTRTVMLEPPRTYEFREDPPVIPDFRFKPEIHVVGLGITVGSCFFGVPLAGIPVEQRTVRITLFVCAPDSG